MITAQIDPDSPVPPFEQLRSQIDTAIRTGLLIPGTQLPTVRQLAGDLGLAPNTVARAYKTLEASGLVEGRGRRGTRVRDTPALSTPERRRLLMAAANRYLDEANRAGFDAAEAIAIAKAVASRTARRSRSTGPPMRLLQGH